MTEQTGAVIADAAREAPPARTDDDAAGLTAGRSAQASIDASRAAALDRFFESYYRLRPVNATFTGVHDYDHTLPDWSPEGLAAARREMSDLRRSLAAAGLGVLDDDAIGGRDWLAIDGALADGFLEIELAELDTLHFQRGNLSLAVGEVVFGLIALMTGRFAGIERRGPAVAARLRAFPLFLVGVRRTLEDVAIPEGWRQRVLRDCEGARVLLDHVEEWFEAEGASPSLVSDARVGIAVARESILWLSAFVRGLPAAKASRYAAGAPFLELLIRRGHFMDVPGDALRREAHESLEDELDRLDGMARGLGAPDWDSVRESIAQQHPSAGGLPFELRAAWQRCEAVVRGHDIVSWPDSAMRFETLPRWLRAAAACLNYPYYRSPAPFDRLDHGEYMLPAIDAAETDAHEAVLRRWNHAAIKLNHVAHHAAIGHHVQNWKAALGASRVGQVAAIGGASRIGMHCGGTMAEGWACYATDLMAGTDYLSDLERAANQHTRVRVLARAIVDLELHGGRMTFEDAIAFYRWRAGMTATAAREEAVTTSMLPGTGLVYWLGMRSIRSLRDRVESTLGGRFSQRAFHDELLGFGSIPASLVAQLMTTPRPAD